jgi:hypothetical protein
MFLMAGTELAKMILTNLKDILCRLFSNDWIFVYADQPTGAGASCSTGIGICVSSSSTLMTAINLHLPDDLIKTGHDQVSYNTHVFFSFALSLYSRLHPRKADSPFLIAASSASAIGVCPPTTSRASPAASSLSNSSARVCAISCLYFVFCPLSAKYAIQSR